MGGLRPVRWKTERRKEWASLKMGCWNSRIFGLWTLKLPAISTPGSLGPLASLALGLWARVSPLYRWAHRGTEMTSTYSTVRGQEWDSQGPSFRTMFSAWLLHTSNMNMVIHPLWIVRLEFSLGLATVY